ncbi:peptidoglycan-binding protein [Kitasatospora sp. NA04385]|nr:peptidoglycan-binding protein [Kitasatospora sp. NA04385]
MFGVYQPLIGWRSGRKRDRHRRGVRAERDTLLYRLQRTLSDGGEVAFNAEDFVSAPGLRPAVFAGPRLVEHGSVVLQEVAAVLRGQGGRPLDADGWRSLLDPELLTRILRTTVVGRANALAQRAFRAATPQQQRATEDIGALREGGRAAARALIDDEASIAGVLAALAESGRAQEINGIFFADLDADGETAFRDELDRTSGRDDDPYLAFDPKGDLGEVSLSPLGVVHLFRQFFFELDTFLGTPTGHVWLSPGSTVELTETTTRRQIVERTVESALESALKSERSTTDQDEFSEAVKQDNKDDLKLGVTTSVNQSWGTGSASATASLNMDKTQQVARETSHKRMRQQSEKLSSEIRQSYKSTFKTMTDVTDTSSKRYVLANTTDDLVNYELRRKMRQIGVQVQDIGSYLCWETFVDEPGTDLGLATLVHLAQPADLLPVPDQTEIPYPPDRMVPFQANATWNVGNGSRKGFYPLTAVDPPAAPDGYVLKPGPGPEVLPATQVSATGDDFVGSWEFGCRINASGQLDIGVVTGPDGLSWNKRVDFVVGGALKYVATDAKRSEVDAANAARRQAGTDASTANDRKTKEAFVGAVKDRIEKAGAVRRRVSEDLREEERIVVYRKLIASLMSSYRYEHAEASSRHVLSELINSVFDIEKMLYFVAPEWWRPRELAGGYLSLQNLRGDLADSLVSWSDSRSRPDNYLITDQSQPAVLGASLGWLLQLDGDGLRNAFLNAPWVKAVIPVRPGKEKAAIAWLQNVGVEGTDGLDALYSAPGDELDAIRAGSGRAAGAPVTIRDAIDHLCRQIADKHRESTEVGSYPATEVDDEDKVSATPVEKVFEHGFYPLEGGFRAGPTDTGKAPDPNNTAPNFQVFDQWIEVLPTDQVVPVPVAYDPRTGRQR